MQELNRNNEILCNAVIWNSSKQCVHKGIYYAFVHNDRIYNIRNSPDSLEIDERVKVGEENEERCIFYDVDKDTYSYSFMKHDKNRSTYGTMYYAKEGFPIKSMELSREEFLEEFNGLMSRLENFTNIEDIIDLEVLKNVIGDVVIEKRV